MPGLQELLKLYGSIEIQNSEGQKVTWEWDYAKDKPVLKSEMSKEDWMQSEMAKWGKVKDELGNVKQNI